MDATSTLPADIDMASKMLRSRPNVAPMHDSLPMDEVEERLQLAGQLIRDEPTWSAIDVSILMAIPLGDIREVAASKTNLLQISFGEIEQFVRMVVLSSLLPSNISWMVD